MKNYIYRMWARFLTQFSKIKVLSFCSIPILAYDPDPYYVTGEDMFEILDVVQPGDVLLRGYDKYLDGKFIPDKHGYSHAGIYIGNHMVVHAVSPCVSAINILDFCQADRILVLRPVEGQVSALERACDLIGVPYDFDYKDDTGKLYCFELVANCYPQAEPRWFKVKKFFGLVKRRCYLAKSFYRCPHFKAVFEKNRLSHIG